MATLLTAIANVTSVSASLTSTTNPSDAMNLLANTVSHTGGSDDNYIKIPACSGPQYFEANHISVSANNDSWRIALWFNDDEENLLYWAPAIDFSQGVPIAGTNKYGNCAILITNSGGNLQVSANQWT